MDNQFFGLNLAQPDPLFILPLVVVATTFAQQKLVSPAAKKDDDDKKGKKKEEDDNPMAGMTQSMQYTMPLMFGFFALSFPAGLSLYFILSNIVGVGQGWLIRRNLPDSTQKRREGQEEMPEMDAGPEPVTSSSDGKSKPKQKKKRSRRKKRSR